MSLRHFLPLLLIGILVAASTGGVLAQDQGPAGPGIVDALPGPGFTYQGELRNGSGPINAACDFEFSLYDALTAGAQLGSTQALSATVASGRFTVLLNDAGQFGLRAFDGSARWLAIEVMCPPDGGFTSLTPRQALTPSPLALALPGLRTEPNATSPNVIGGHLSNTVSVGVVGATIGGGGSLGFNANGVSANYGTVGGGNANTAGGDYSTVGGGRVNVASGVGATVGGGGYDGNLAAGNEATSPASTVGGGLANDAKASYATVSGGAQNSALGWGAVIGGGANNVVTSTAFFGTIGGGVANTAGADYATVGGGNSNMATGVGATVGGGGRFGSTSNGNDATGAASTIGGGFGNTASFTGTVVGGGFTNTASAEYATVGGGESNTAVGNHSTVGGGTSNYALGLWSVVAGGLANYAGSDIATVAGGQGNQAIGAGAMIPGGYSNSATGAYSFAAGSFAHADHAGAFVWNCLLSCDINFSSGADNQFVINAAGGYWLGKGGSTTGPGGALAAGEFLSTTTGAYLSTTGVWTDLSDRNAKTDFAPVDGPALLDALMGLPIESWTYKAEGANVRHIGPTAQDFQAAFGVGAYDTHLAALDTSGVALAAVQQAYAVVQAQDARIAALETQLAAMEAGTETPQQRVSTTAPVTLPWLLLGGLVLLNVGGVAGYALARRKRG